MFSAPSPIPQGRRRAKTINSISRVRRANSAPELTRGHSPGDEFDSSYVRPPLIKKRRTSISGRPRGRGKSAGDDILATSPRRWTPRSELMQQHSKSPASSLLFNFKNMKINKTPKQLEDVDLSSCGETPIENQVPNFSAFADLTPAASGESIFPKNNTFSSGFSKRSHCSSSRRKMRLPSGSRNHVRRQLGLVTPGAASISTPAPPTPGTMLVPTSSCSYRSLSGQCYSINSVKSYNKSTPQLSMSAQTPATNGSYVIHAQTPLSVGSCTSIGCSPATVNCEENATPCGQRFFVVPTRPSKCDGRDNKRGRRRSLSHWDRENFNSMVSPNPNNPNLRGFVTYGNRFTSPNPLASTSPTVVPPSSGKINSLSNGFRSLRRRASCSALPRPSKSHQRALNLSKETSSNETRGNDGLEQKLYNLSNASNHSSNSTTSHQIVVTSEDDIRQDTPMNAALKYNTNVTSNSEVTQIANSNIDRRSRKDNRSSVNSNSSVPLKVKQKMKAECAESDARLFSDITNNMKMQGIELLCIDWDKTFIPRHTKNNWYAGPEELSRVIRPTMISLVRAAVKSDLKIGIVTFSTQIFLIKETMSIAFPDVDPNSYVVRGCNEDGHWQSTDEFIMCCAHEMFPKLAEANQQETTNRCSMFSPDKTLNGPKNFGKLLHMCMVAECHQNRNRYIESTKNNEENNSMNSSNMQGVSTLKRRATCPGRVKSNIMDIEGYQDDTGKQNEEVPVLSQSKSMDTIDTRNALMPCVMRDHSNTNEFAYRKDVQNKKCATNNLSLTATKPVKPGKENILRPMKVDASKGYPRQAFTQNKRSVPANTREAVESTNVVDESRDIINLEKTDDPSESSSIIERKHAVNVKENASQWKAHEIVLIDDDENNIRIAKKHGVHSFTCPDTCGRPEELIRALQQAYRM